MSYVVKDAYVVDLKSDSKINLESIICNDYALVHNQEESNYYLVAITYVFEPGITYKELEYADCFNDETYFIEFQHTYCLAEFYTLPDLKFIGFAPSINYYDFSITTNGVVDLKQKIIYMPTKDGIKILKLNKSDRAKQ
jgi:hypothetical protein